MTKNYRMMGPSDSERISMICSAVLIQSTRVTDRRKDGRTDRLNRRSIGPIRAIACMLSRVKTERIFNGVIESGRFGTMMTKAGFMGCSRTVQQINYFIDIKISLQLHTALVTLPSNYQLGLRDESLFT